MVFRQRPGKRGTGSFLCTVAVFWALAQAGARAAITITGPAITLPYSVAAQVGTFEVFVQSNASPQPQVGSFNVEIQLPSFSGITFTPPPGPTTNTTPTNHPYIFSGQSPTEAVLPNGHTVRGSDFAFSDPVPTLFDGAGLLLVTYAVPAGTSGIFPLTFIDYSHTSDPLGTALFGATNNQIPTVDQSGTITILPPTAYWRGTTDAVWTTDNLQTGVTNWTLDAAGMTDTHTAPGASTDVFFVSGGAANLNTTLGSNYSIKGLTFTSTATSPVSISGNTLTIGSDGLTVQAGSAAHTINSAVTLGGSQTWHVANDPAAPLTVAGTLTLPASTTLTKSDGGTLRITAAPTLGNNSSISVTGGAVKFNVATGVATVGTGVSATIAAGATLELAGSVSALSSPAAVTDRVNITNNSSAGGLVVSGTNQQVGAITGSGTTTIAAGGGLTANSVIQDAIVIAGTAGSHATLTLAQGDSSGNSLVSTGSSLALAGLEMRTASPAMTSGGTASSGLLAAPLSAETVAVGSGVSGLSSSSSVPEPSSVLLAVAAALIAVAIRKRHRISS